MCLFSESEVEKSVLAFTPNITFASASYVDMKCSTINDDTTKPYMARFYHNGTEVFNTSGEPMYRLLSLQPDDAGFYTCSSERIVGKGVKLVYARSDPVYLPVREIRKNIFRFQHIRQAF